MKGKIETRTLDEIKDKFIGETGSPEREQYELDLRLGVIGDVIRNTRKALHLTQEQLGDLIGVKKAQISKIENNTKDIRLSTIMKTFKALQANVKLVVEIDKP
jgi:DNA-binding XRE family transcriptional regulator